MQKALGIVPYILRGNFASVLNVSLYVLTR
jgi:hypothetical protein